MHQFYAAPHSLYSAKARCYLRKQGIAYREVMPTDARFEQHIVPRIGRGIIPVLETVDGQIIQDTVDIIDHFEAQGVRYPAYPSGPRQRVLALMIEYYASLPMLRPAMHYRWSFFAQQERFIRDAFVAGSGVQAAEKIMGRMASYLPALGVSEATIPLIEASHERLLDILEAHFAEHPYLFGGRPSIGDYGLIGPLFAHLGRDPVPEQIMKQRAPKVFRWAERMNAGDLDSPEFPAAGDDFLADDAIPATLEPLLRHIAEEVFPELDDCLTFLDQWIEREQPQDGDPVAREAHQRRLGGVQTSFRGAPVQAGVQPYMIYLLRRVDHFIAGLDAPGRQAVEDYLQAVGLARLRVGSRGYSVGRRNNIEVWEISGR
jgi:glutathione S-transferase